MQRDSASLTFCYRWLHGLSPTYCVLQSPNNFRVFICNRKRKTLLTDCLVASQSNIHFTIISEEDKMEKQLSHLSVARRETIAFLWSLHMELYFRIIIKLCSPPPRILWPLASFAFVFFYQWLSELVKLQYLRVSQIYFGWYLCLWAGIFNNSANLTEWH